MKLEELLDELMQEVKEDDEQLRIGISTKLANKIEEVLGVTVSLEELTYVRPYVTYAVGGLSFYLSIIGKLRVSDGYRVADIESVEDLKEYLEGR